MGFIDLHSRNLYRTRSVSQAFALLVFVVGVIDSVSALLSLPNLYSGNRPYLIAHISNISILFSLTMFFLVRIWVLEKSETFKYPTKLILWSSGWLVVFALRQISLAVSTGGFSSEYEYGPFSGHHYIYWTFESASSFFNVFTLLYLVCSPIRHLITLISALPVFSQE